MTTVRLWRDGDGCLSRCEAAGHAAFAARGTDIVCAAETILLRTAMQVLGSMEGVALSADTGRRGVLSFTVRLQDGLRSDAALCGRLRGVADFLSGGLRSLAEEYPAHVQVQELSGWDAG